MSIEDIASWQVKGRACAYCSEPATGWTLNSMGTKWPCCDEHTAGTHVEPLPPDPDRLRLRDLLRALRGSLRDDPGPLGLADRDRLREALDLLDAGVTP